MRSSLFSLLSAFVLILVLTVSGCTQSGNPPGNITSDIGTQQPGLGEIIQSQPETQIEIHDRNFSAVVSPTVNEVVSGNVSVKFNALPPDSAKVWVMVFPEGAESVGNIDEENNTMLQIINASLGDEFVIETENFDDGTYNLNIMTAAEDPPAGYPWITVTTTQVVFNNSDNESYDVQVPESNETEQENNTTEPIEPELNQTNETAEYLPEMNDSNWTETEQTDINFTEETTPETNETYENQTE